MNNKGFTLVEIIAVIMILGLIAIITTPAYNSISTNIKKRNYESKKNTIQSQTLSYVEKYLKDEIYGKKKDGSGNLISVKYCFSTGYLIQNGIITSDDEEKEYILNDENGDKYDDHTKKAYVIVTYDNDKFKLNATFTPGEAGGCDKKFEGV